jgi:hypothetical protein
MSNGFVRRLKRHWPILLLIAVLLNPFDLGLWINKIFGDVIHFTIFFLVIILLWYANPAHTLNGKMKKIGGIFKIK